eukprot:TRINITY_DN769_c2_g5_i1.p1 TRINITY_DN769_c2_g5~~TRINITY_DN769_c2_g5_i1.p1  ORF type:complete len:202 (-),score=10.59 TRINITY_DN769_c2_g5_i1:47-652(-)
MNPKGKKANPKEGIPEGIIDEKKINLARAEETVRGYKELPFQNSAKTIASETDTKKVRQVSHETLQPEVTQAAITQWESTKQHQQEQVAIISIQKQPQVWGQSQLQLHLNRQYSTESLKKNFVPCGHNLEGQLEDELFTDPRELTQDELNEIYGDGGEKEQQKTKSNKKIRQPFTSKGPKSIREIPQRFIYRIIYQTKRTR